MRAGKELNIAIAEYVFHLSVRLMSTPPVPYSTDITYAKKVLDQMELYNHTYIIHAPNETQEKPRYGYVVNFIDLDTKASSVSDGMTLEEAICRAALVTKGVVIK